MRRMGLPPSEFGTVTAWVAAAARRITRSSLAPNTSVRTRLFRKYVALFVTIVSTAPLANGLLDIWFSYQDHKDALIRISELVGSENILLPMHDAILIQCTELEADFQRKEISKLMKDTFVRWCPGVRPQVSVGAYASE